MVTLERSPLDGLEKAGQAVRTEAKWNAQEVKRMLSTWHAEPWLRELHLHSMTRHTAGALAAMARNSE